MGKADFGAIDGAIASGLEDGEEVMVARIEDDALNGRLCKVRRSIVVSLDLDLLVWPSERCWRASGDCAP